MPGHPDFQAFPQWIGDPLVSNASLAIGNGSHTDSGLNVSNFASVIIAIKPTGGGITATLKQTIHNGPTALALSTQWTVRSGVTTFEQIILQGSIVELDLQGDTGGETVAYAVYGSNTATNSQVSSVSTINFLHNGVNVKAEPGLDLEDAAAAAVGIPGLTWTVTDNAGTDVSYLPVLTAPLTPVLSYVERTSSLGITATTEATAQVVVTAASVTFDGTSHYILEFFFSNFKNATANANEVVLLFHDDTAGAGIGQFQDANVGAALDAFGGGTFRRRLVPAAGARTYSVRGFVNNANGVNLVAGAGGAGTILPAYIRVVKDL